MTRVVPMLAGVVAMAAFRSVVVAQTQPWISLPTENRAIFEGRPQKFYMYVDRTFEGVQSKPWEGGQYGFTRSPRREGGRLLYTRFHEGVDIGPVRRDAHGEPLDPVFAAADGKVVHVSTDATASNYGRYIVIQHDLGGSPYFTLYAHLMGAAVEPGQMVRRGQPVGRLGYTGAGINRERAHLHFEFCMMLNRNFESWFEHYIRTSINRHGIFNGMNLNGMDPIGLIKAVRANPATTVPDFVGTLTPLFRITVTDSPNFDLIRLYPWLVSRGEPASSPGWAVTFSDSFVPMKIEARPAPQGGPGVEWLGGGEVALAHQSRGLVTGTPAAPRLTDSGNRFAHLLTFPDQ